jgi:hypothetical protein
MMDSKKMSVNMLWATLEKGLEVVAVVIGLIKVMSTLIIEILKLILGAMSLISCFMLLSLENCLNKDFPVICVSFKGLFRDLDVEGFLYLLAYSS